MLTNPDPSSNPASACGLTDSLSHQVFQACQRSLMLRSPPPSPPVSAHLSPTYPSLEVILCLSLNIHSLLPQGPLLPPQPAQAVSALPGEASSLFAGLLFSASVSSSTHPSHGSQTQLPQLMTPSSPKGLPYHITTYIQHLDTWGLAPTFLLSLLFLTFLPKPFQPQAYSPPHGCASR